MHLVRTTQDSFFHHPSPGGVRDLENKTNMATYYFCPGLEEHWGGQRAPGCPREQAGGAGGERGRKWWFPSAAGGEIQQDGCFVSA